MRRGRATSYGNLRSADTLVRARQQGDIARMPLHPVHRAFALATLLASVASAQDARLIPAPREISTPSASVRFRGPITFAPLAENDDRAAARERGRTHWYEGYTLRVAKVERAYEFPR